ncbi:hypothetical protein [Vibrio owensii]|uniref:hypothetical protein n=1 Tax=Vibrio owensii TaxID=696485 RepID=UPI0018F26FE8|nr:hypothetical protein [Vibrio owensii]
MLNLLTQYENVSIVTNVIDKENQKFGITVMPKQKSPLVIVFSQDEIGDVERQIEDYLSDPDHIVNASNIASVKDTQKPNGNSTKTQATTVTTSPAPSKQQKKESQKENNTQSSAERTDGDFSDLLNDLGI